jgi:hypothetical protein
LAELVRVKNLVFEFFKQTAIRDLTNSKRLIALKGGIPELEKHQEVVFVEVQLLDQVISDLGVICLEGQRFA